MRQKEGKDGERREKTRDGPNDKKYNEHGYTSKLKRKSNKRLSGNMKEDMMAVGISCEHTQHSD